METFNSKRAYLILADGTVFNGFSFGAPGTAIGEAVFTTSMTGYQETLTDPNYYGQLITQTFPMIGNYGVNSADNLSERSVAGGYIVREHCEDPSNFRSEDTIDSFLKKHGIVGIYGIDTRRLTRIIREKGVMNAIITDWEPNIEEALPKMQNYKIPNGVSAVSVREKCVFNTENPVCKVAVIDFGYKFSLRGELQKHGCQVTVLPYNTAAGEILGDEYDGIILSNGPGDPTENKEAVQTVRELMKSGKPMLGIGLGHQIIALANGGITDKLKYGHRGANQPVIDTAAGMTFITSQNHGFVVNETPENGIITHINANDKTCEGIRYHNIPVFSVQFMPLSNGSANDTSYIYDRFIKLMK